MLCREFRDYVQWLKGNYVPTEAKLRSMVESGFVFPETCKSILKPMEVNIMVSVTCVQFGIARSILNILCWFTGTYVYRLPRQWITSSFTVMPTTRRWGIK